MGEPSIYRDTDVRRGQVWRDNDDRGYGKGEFEVVGFGYADEPAWAYFRDDRPLRGMTHAVVLRLATNRRTKILLRRLVSGGHRGYELLSGPRGYHNVGGNA
jgi:hypothetical protein